MASSEFEIPRSDTTGWNRTRVGQKFGLLTGFIVMLVAGIMVITWSWSPAYRILFSSLDDQDAITVINALYSNGFDVKLDESSGAILVPANEIQFARIKLSNLGLPGIRKSRPGYREGILEQNPLYDDLPTQDPIGYIQRVEEILSRRIEHLLEPLVGVGSIRAQVTINKTVELDADNNIIKDKALPSKDSLNEQKQVSNKNANNLSNLVDKNTNLSVTVLVDDKQILGKNDEVIFIPRTQDEIKKLTDIVKKIINYDSSRGDSINILNSQFTSSIIPNVISKSGFLENIRSREWLRKGIGVLVLVIIASFTFWYFLKASPGIQKDDSANQDNNDVVNKIPLDSAEITNKKYEDNMRTASILAINDPKLVAQVLKNWISADG